MYIYMSMMYVGLFVHLCVLVFACAVNCFMDIVLYMIEYTMKVWKSKLAIKCLHNQ